MITRVKGSVPSPFWQPQTSAGSPFAQKIRERRQNVYLHFTDSITTQTSEQEFDVLTATWKNDMRFSSSIHSLMTNPSYLRVIAMGKKAIPLILEDLKQEPDHWFIALNILTGQDPVPNESRGDVIAMTAAWLQWGRENKYVT